MGSHVPSFGTPAATSAPGNLPAELNRFVGRTRELAEVAEMLTGSRLVTVTGAGGLGKSRLALRVAAQVRDRFPDGVWLVELSALPDPELLGHAVAQALGLTDHTTRRARAVVAEHLAPRTALVVLDCCEHLVGACASLAEELLRRSPGLRLLVTSRHLLDVDGEHVYPLAPLPAPGPGDRRGANACAMREPGGSRRTENDGEGRPARHAVPHGTLAVRNRADSRDSDAARLFADRAAAVVPGFALDAANRGAVARLCHRLDGIPLAIELAAGRMRALSVEQLLDRLDDPFALLTSGRRTGPVRHRAMRTAIGWSHELCSPAERLLWARLSVFAGDFDLEAAEYVCAGDGLPTGDILELVSDLVAKSVVLREGHPGVVRYRLLDTVREYGLDWLRALGDTERLQRRHRDWYLGLATWNEVDWFSPRQAEVAARTRREFPNLRLALEFSLTAPGDAYLGQYMAGTLWFYWVGCGQLAEGWHWLNRALDLEGEHDDARAKALWVAGYVAILQGNTVRALGLLHECAAQALRCEDEVASAYAQHRLGCLALVSDDMPRAEELLRDALARYRDVGEMNSNVIMAQVELALAVAFQGRLEEAVEECEDVRRICEDHGERWALAYALYVLGYAAWTRGETRRARHLVEECLEINHSFHDLVGTVLAVELLALLNEEGGDPTEAALLQGAATRMWRSVGLPLFGSRCFNAPRLLCEQRVRARLGDEAYRSAFAAGEALGGEEAVGRLLSGPGGAERTPVHRPTGVATRSGPVGAAEEADHQSQVTGRPDV